MVNLSINSDAIDAAFDLVGEDADTGNAWVQARLGGLRENMEETKVDTAQDTEVDTVEDTAAETETASPEDVLEAIKRDPFAIRNVPKRAQTDEEVLLAVADDGSGKERPALDDKGIAKARVNTKLFEELLKVNPWRIDEVPEKKLSRALVKTAILASKGHPEVLSKVPERFRTKPIYNYAVEVEPESLQYVPDDIKTRKMCKAAVDADYKCIQWVGKGLIDVKTRKAAEKQLKADAERKAQEEAEAKAKAEAEEQAKREAEEAARAETVTEAATANVETSEAAPVADITVTMSVPKDAKRINPIRLHFQLIHEG